MENDYTLEDQTGNWETKISPKTQYGYFENQKTGTFGGLWFKGKTLTDYDGTYELPEQVKISIRHLGYKISKEF